MALGASICLAEPLKQARWAISEPVHASLLRDIFGNPFHSQATLPLTLLAWNDRTVPRLAQSIYDKRNFALLPILADALEDASCTDRAILDHCRGPGPHVRGCWAVDLLLGKQ
jgi:hypothetical protein